jgi:hypothetical protein
MPVTHAAFVAAAAERPRRFRRAARACEGAVRIASNFATCLNEIAEIGKKGTLSTERGGSREKLQFVIVAALALALPGHGESPQRSGHDLGDGVHAEDRDAQLGDTVKWRTRQGRTTSWSPTAGIRIADPQAGRLVPVHVQERGKFTYHDALKPALKGTVTSKGRLPSVTSASAADHHLRAADEPFGTSRTVSRTSPW